MNSLLNKAQNYYAETLQRSALAHKSLRESGITNGDLAELMGLGYIDATFKEVLNNEEKKQAIDSKLFSTRHEERTHQCLSIPLFQQNQLTGFATWKNEKSIKGHLGDGGLGNSDALKNHEEVIIVDSPSLYLHLRNEGHENALLFPFACEASINDINSSRVQTLYVNSRKDITKFLEFFSSCRKTIKTIKLPKDNHLIDIKVYSEALEKSKLHKEAEVSTVSEEALSDGTYRYTFDSTVSYTVRPITLNVTTLKVMLTVEQEGIRYTDKLDLYVASSQRAFSKSCSEKFLEDHTHYENDLYRIMEALEKVRDAKGNGEIISAELTNKEEEESHHLLKSKNLFSVFLKDMKKIEVVGEESNLKLGLLMSISRLLDKPLSVIVQSSSGAGKSNLLNTICSITPPESLLFMSKLTPSSLYYMNDLRHKLLCVDESHGSQDSLYPLRTLQSNHKLVLACPVKDGATGTTVTKQIEVHGPVSFIESTTSNKLHPENASRAMILKMDESQEQTKRILKVQRKSVTTAHKEKAKEAIFKKWQNAQRYIAKRILPVIVPFADLLKFPASPSSRRDNIKFLSLIRSIALLRMFQKEVKEDEGGKYIEADIEDYKIAYELFLPLMKNPDDDLSQRAKEFLKLLNGRSTPFTRREIVESHKWSYRRVWETMEELMFQDIIVQDHSPKGKAPQFVLLTDSYIPDARVKGLIAPESLNYPVLSATYPEGADR